MSTLRNPVWIGFNGEPIAGRTPPRMQVHGSALSKAQMGEVAHAYHQFCTANGLALGQYQSRERKLADGTRVRMVSINGVDTVQVWPTGGEEVACETLFYGRPASADHVNGYTPPEMSGTTTIWPEYNQKNAPPDALKYIDSTQLYGESTWYSSKIKLNVEGYSPVMPAVVSWRGRGYRYGAYGQTQPNYKPFIEGTRPQRVPSVFPGQDYGSSHNGAASSTVWINDTQFDAWANVFGAGLRKIENEGVFLYVAETPTLFQLKVYRMPIKLPLRKGNGGSLGPGELVATFDFDYFDPYQGPFFNESCTKMVMLAVVEIDGNDQTCVVECDIDAGTYQIVHAATRKITSAGWTETYSATASVTDIGAQPGTTFRVDSSSSSLVVETTDPRKDVREYAIAVDYRRDNLVYLIAKFTVESDWDAPWNTVEDTTFSNGDVPTFYGKRLEHYNIAAKIDVIHSEHGSVYSTQHSEALFYEQELSQTDYDHFETIPGTDPPEQEWVTGAATGYKQYAIAPGSYYTDDSKVQTVGGDLRHDFFILADSTFVNAWVEDFSYTGAHENTSAEVLFSGGGGSMERIGFGASTPFSAPTERYLDSISLPVKYVVVKDGGVVFDSGDFKFAIDRATPLITQTYPGPDHLRQGNSYAAYYPHTTGLSAKSSTTTIAPVEYPAEPYVAPVSQPTFFPIQASGDLYNAIVAANGNNQPGACCAIAWSPTFPGDPKPEVGYVSFISPRLWDADGNEVPRVEFTKWYIGGQWVDSPIYAPGEQQTIVRPIFMGTQLK